MFSLIEEISSLADQPFRRFFEILSLRKIKIIIQYFIFVYSLGPNGLILHYHYHANACSAGLRGGTPVGKVIF